MEKKIRKKNLLKIIKPLVKSLREVKQMILIVEEGWISGFTVEGGKSDFYNSRGGGSRLLYIFC